MLNLSKYHYLHLIPISKSGSSIDNCFSWSPSNFDTFYQACLFYLSQNWSLWKRCKTWTYHCLHYVNYRSFYCARKNFIQNDFETRFAVYSNQNCPLYHFSISKKWVFTSLAHCEIPTYHSIFSMVHIWSNYLYLSIAQHSYPNHCLCLHNLFSNSIAESYFAIFLTNNVIWQHYFSSTMIRYQIFKLDFNLNCYFDLDSCQYDQFSFSWMISDQIAYLLQSQWRFN